MIEDKIKKEFDDYEIKTTSQMILDKYPRKKSRFKKKVFLPIIFSLSTAAIAVITLILVLQTNNILPSSGEKSYSSSVSLNDSDLTTQVAIEVLYAGNMSKDSRTSARQGVSTDEYTEIVGNADKIYPLVSDLYNGLDSFEIEYFNGEYEIGNNKYKYKYKIDDYILYANDNMFKNSKKRGETEMEGDIALEINGNIYNGKLEIELESDEEEVTISYVAGSQTITIEREIETDEGETETVYCYRVSEDDYEYVKKITAKEADGVKTFKYKYENDYNDITEKLKLYEKSDYYLVNYSYVSEDKSLSLDGIKLTISDDGRTYSYNDMEIKK